LPALSLRAAIDGQVETQRRDEVRGKLEQRLALMQRFAHETELAVLEVAEAAVDQPGRRARRAARDVGLLEHEHALPGERGLARDPRAVDAGADDDDVEGRQKNGVRHLFREPADAVGRKRCLTPFFYARVCPLPRTTYL